MTKKQKKVLYRIIISLVLLVAVSIVDTLVELPLIAQVILYLIPYFIIGYDILKKAGKGILNRQVFDENFLMAVATVGAILLGDFREGSAVMLFYQIVKYKCIDRRKCSEKCKMRRRSHQWMYQSHWYDYIENDKRIWRFDGI